MVLETLNFTGLSTLLDSYQIQARTEGKTPNTIRIYTTALSVLTRFLELRGYSTDATRIGPGELREFIGYLQNVRAFSDHPFTEPQGKGLTGHTVNCYLRAIRAFWSWLVAEDIIESNPFDRVKVPKPPKKVIRAFSESQIHQMLDALDTHSSTGFRDRTIILTLLDTGLRVSELTDLQLEDTDIRHRCLKVSGKGNKERFVPIGVLVQRTLVKYVGKHRPHPASPLFDNLFLTRDGMPLTPNRVESIVERYARKAGISGVRASPHTFRHTFSVSYLRNGGDVFTLQRILGHETLDMVRNYVNLAQYDLQEAHLRCSPVDRMLVRPRNTARQLPTRKSR